MHRLPELNDVTIKDAHFLPRIDDTLEALKGAKYFSTLDLNLVIGRFPSRRSISLKPPLGLAQGSYTSLIGCHLDCNAPATFSRLMDNVLSGLSWKICLPDDIIVFSKG